MLYLSLTPTNLHNLRFVLLSEAPTEPTMALMGEAEWFTPLAGLQVQKHLREEHLSEIESVFSIVAPSEEKAEDEYTRVTCGYAEITLGGFISTFKRGRKTENTDVGMHVSIRIRPSLGILRWLCRRAHEGVLLINWLEFSQHWSQLIEEHWGAHVTGPPNPKGTLSAALALSILPCVKHLVTKTLFPPNVFHPSLLTEPWCWFWRCLRALSLEEEAAVSELPLVPWTRLPWNANLQQHHHVRGGKKWTFFFFSPLLL